MSDINWAVAAEALRCARGAEGRLPELPFDLRNATVLSYASDLASLGEPLVAVAPTLCVAGGCQWQALHHRPPSRRADEGPRFAHHASRERASSPMFTLAVVYLIVLVGTLAHLLPALSSARWRPAHGWATGFPLGVSAVLALWGLLLPASVLAAVAWIVLLALHGSRRGWTAFLAGLLTVLVAVLLWDLLTG